MFQAFLKELTGVLDRRLILHHLIPSLVVFCLLGVVALVGGERWSKAVGWWFSQDLGTQVIFAGAAVIAVTFFAMMMQNQSVTILRFYEGYWESRPGRWIASLRIKRYQQRLLHIYDKLEKDPGGVEYRHIYLFYPLKSHISEVMPTKLGNVIKNSELYPMDRYGIDAVLIWPRLFHVLPASFIQNFAGHRWALDSMLFISCLGFLTALLAPLILLVICADAEKWWCLGLPCIAGGVAITWFAYKAAIRRALLYSDQVKAAFDLYRDRLLKEMRIPAPANLAEEKQLWTDLCNFLYRNFGRPAAEWVYEIRPNDPANSRESPPESP